MNKKQLSEHIGNIDDRLIQQAENIPNYAAIHRKERMKRFLSAAAILMLMISSFSAGAITFAREVVVEVPIEKETLVLEDVELTLLLPDSWEGQYDVIKDEDNYVVYIPWIDEAWGGSDVYDGGVLFTIACWDEAMTEEQFIENGYDIVAYRYILATDDHTYILHYASDVQFDWNDEEQNAVYSKMMSEIKDIQFVVNNVFED